MHPYYGPSGRFTGDSWLGLASMAAYLAFWAVAIPVTVRLLKPLAHPAAADRSLQILRERYARGELSAEQFREMTAVLAPPVRSTHD